MLSGKTSCCIDYRKPNPLLQALIHRPNLYYSKIYQKGNWKRNIQSPLEQEKTQSPRHPAQNSPFGGAD